MRAAVLLLSAVAVNARCRRSDTNQPGTTWSGVASFKRTNGVKQEMVGVEVSEGMLGWEANDMSPIMRQSHPVHLREKVRAFFPEHDASTMGVGAQYEFHCPANCDDAPCEVLVHTYHCYPCSKDLNGGFPSLMPAHDWSPGHCAPRFDFAGEPHRMVAFRRLVPAGQTLTTPAADKLLWHTFATVRQGAVACETLNRRRCLRHDECRLGDDDSTCLSDWCPKPKPGKLPDCKCAPRPEP